MRTVVVYDSAAEVVTKLKAAGLKVRSYQESGELTDGEIELDYGYDVQVGYDYLCFCRNNYDSNGDLESVSYILDNTSIPAIVSYMKALQRIDDAR